MDLQTKKKKTLPDFQAYSRLYYNDRVKAVFERRWEEEKERVRSGEQESMPSIVKFRNKITQELLAAESDEVKAAVETYRHKIAGKKEGGEEDDGLDEETSETMGEQADRAVEYIK